MFVGERLVYLQLQKTGCSHVAKLLAECIEGEQIGEHNRLPPDFALGGRSVVGSIRSPWDWYVSLWAFGCSGLGGFQRRVSSRWLRQYARWIPQHPRLGLTGFARELGKPIDRWQAMYESAESPELFREWLRLTLDHQHRFDFGEGYGFSSVSSFAGFLTFRYLRLHSRDLVVISSRGPTSLASLREVDAENSVLDHVIKTETLEDDLIQVLGACGYDLDDQQRHRILSAGKTNTSIHLPMADYYDAETIDLVGDRERFIIEKYGYTSPVPA